MNAKLGYEDPLSSPGKRRESFDAIKQWLSERGCNISTGRFAEYAKFIDCMEHCEANQITAPKYNMLEIATFHREISELDFVFSRFVKQQSGMTDELLKGILQGHALPTQDPALERCRNFLLQLRAAAYFIDSGFQVDVSADADVVAKRDDKTYYVECKRIYSAAQIEKRCRELGKQLSTRLANHRDSTLPFGIAWIDPTAVLVNNIGLYSAYSRVACQVAVRVDLNLFADQCPFLMLQTDKRILGAVIQMVFPSICANDSAPINVGFTSLICPLTSEKVFREQARPLFDQLMTQIQAPVSSQF